MHNFSKLTALPASLICQMVNSNRAWGDAYHSTFDTDYGIYSFSWEVTTQAITIRLVDTSPRVLNHYGILVLIATKSLNVLTVLSAIPAQ